MSAGRRMSPGTLIGLWRLAQPARRLCLCTRPPGLQAVFSYWRPLMIAMVPTADGSPVSRETAESFEPLLTSIRRTAFYAFRRMPTERRDELLAEVVARAYVAFVRLV